MRKLIFSILLLLATPLLAEEADLLVYEVKEEGLPKYLSRILVSDAFVRIDEGEESSSGYTLYNRVSHVLYNVDPEEGMVLLLTPPDPQPQVPEGLHLEEKLAADPDAPEIAGRQLRKLQLYANGRLCRTLQVVEGLLPKAVQGLRELRLALARLQGDVPLDADSDACELVEYVYAPTRALAYGLPLVDLMQRKQQWLVDFDSRREVQDALFQVPEEYEPVVPPTLGGR